MACAFRAFLAKFSNLYCTLAFKMAQILDQHFQIFVQEKKSMVLTAFSDQDSEYILPVRKIHVDIQRCTSVC